MTKTWAGEENKVSLWDDMYKSGHYKQTWSLEFPSPELIGVLMALDMPKGTKCLDVGCGSGADLEHLAEKGFDVIGLDISPIAINIVKKRLEAKNLKAKLLVGDILNMSLGSEKFDFVADRGCLHHIANEKRNIYANVVGKVIKPGGYLFLRGCRIEGKMWIPLALDEINQLFPSKYFKNLGFDHFKYDAPRAIRGAITLIRKL